MTIPTFVTYHSTNAKPSEAWIAYVNGWQVRCVGSTEQEAKDRALSLWNRERERWGRLEAASATRELNAGAAKAPAGWGDKQERKAITQLTDHGNAGKVWMRHPEHGLQRVPMTEITMREGQGWYRSGPRGK